MAIDPEGSLNKKPKNPTTLVRTFGRCKFYPKLLSAYLKKIQSSFQLLILTLKICGSVIQKNFGRLFHTISFLQLLFILLKLYLFFKNKICG